MANKKMAFRGSYRHAPKVEKPFHLLRQVFLFVQKRYGFLYLLVFALAAVSVVASVQGTLFTKSLIDEYVLPLIGSSSPDFSLLKEAIYRVALFYGIGVVASLGQQLLLIHISQGTLRDLRYVLFEHMQSLPIAYFDQHPHGDIMSIYTNDVDMLRQMLSQSLPYVLQDVFQIVLVLVNMFLLSPILSFISLGMIALIVFSSKTISSLSGRFYAQQQKETANLDAYVEEMIAGQRVIKSFTREKQSQEEFRQRNEKLAEASYQANRFSSILFPVNFQLSNMNYALCACVGGYFVLQGFGGFTIGALASFLSFNKQFAGPISQISSQVNAILMGLAGADRIFSLLAQEAEKDEGYVTLVNQKEVDGKWAETSENTNHWAWKLEQEKEVIYRPLKGEVVFEKVDFSYDGKHPILREVSITAQPGEKIALVGSTGAGKTTIMNLINRFYDIQKGNILYDGIPIKDIRKQDLRRSLGMVLQETHLFSHTIEENIRYGRLSASEEEVKAAAMFANAHHFIHHLKETYHHHLVNAGENLSQGQRQLLSIARATIANPPVLILDEATSSIDTHTEALLQEGMDKLMANRTTFVIAHRLSTVRNADVILVLEKGKIMERGNHEELLANKGRYYQLYTGQKKA